MQAGSSLGNAGEAEKRRGSLVRYPQSDWSAMARIGRTANLGVNGVYRNGAPGTIRTSDPQIRSLMLYPAELRARVSPVIGGLSARLPPGKRGLREGGLPPKGRTGTRP